MSSFTRHLIALGSLLIVTFHLCADPELAPSPRLVYPPVPGYRTVENAYTVKLAPAPAGRSEHAAYLGVSVMRGDKGQPVVEEVQADSPAAKAGIKKGDVITRVGEQSVKTPQAFREWLQTRSPGEEVRLGLLRDAKPIEATAKLIAASRPMKLGGSGGGPRAFLGLDLGDAKQGEGVRIASVVNGSPAAVAGLKEGDRLLQLDGTELARASRLTELLTEKRPGDTLIFLVRRNNREFEVKAMLAGERGKRDAGGGTISLWRRNVFRLAVIGIEFSDVKHNEKITPQELEKALFSKGSYLDKSATGQLVYGSLNDYFLEQSAGAFHIEGKVFDWIEVAKKRADYVQGSGTSNKTQLLTDALEKLTARDGRNALGNFDGLLFLYAGDSYRTNRGAVYFPHAGIVNHHMRRLPYLIGPEGGKSLTSISGLAKEMSQVLGLPDLAARTENAGSEGLGSWCALSNPLGSGRPQHLSAWAKEKLGWIKPATIDPTVKQKLVLAPIEDSPKECIKVLVRPYGSEYFLLENRKRKGFDADLPGEGLLIWRIVNDRPILEESHGVAGPMGPTVHLSAVPYPSAANSAFTPETTPSSRSPHGGGLPVYIMEIRRLEDGRIALQIGYEYR